MLPESSYQMSLCYAHICRGAKCNVLTCLPCVAPCRKEKTPSRTASRGASIAAIPASAAARACTSVPCSCRRLDHKKDCSVTCTKQRSEPHATAGAGALVDKVLQSHLHGKGIRLFLFLQRIHLDLSCLSAGNIVSVLPAGRSRNQGCIEASGGAAKWLPQ